MTEDERFDVLRRRHHPAIAAIIAYQMCNPHAVSSAGRKYQQRRRDPGSAAPQIMPVVAAFPRLSQVAQHTNDRELRKEIRALLEAAS